MKTWKLKIVTNNNNNNFDWRHRQSADPASYVRDLPRSFGCYRATM